MAIPLSSMPSSIQLNWFLLRSFLATLCLTLAVSALEFHYANFLPENSNDFIFTNSSSIADGALQITPNSNSPAHQSGRVFYKQPFKHRRSNGSAITSIYTNFTLNIRPLTQPGGEGLTFILTNNPALPSDSSGQWLGISNNQTDSSPDNHIVAIEFDTRKSFADDLDDNHVGLDVNGVKSLQQLSFSSVGINISTGIDLQVSIIFDAELGAVALSAVANRILIFGSNIDLSKCLAEDVWVGFSASTSSFTQLNQIKSWSFSSMDIETTVGKKETRVIRLIWLLAMLLLLPASAAGLYLNWKRKKRNSRALKNYRNLARQEIALALEGCSKRPVKFQLKELKKATANFDPNRQLGKGGFGTVYRGHLPEYCMEVAVKRIARTSRRGEREFLAEVTTISQLSHRNLVKLIGWCIEKEELLVVYEFLYRGSLDRYLFGSGENAEETPVLDWATRFKIVYGVASALDYLHHGSVKRVLHRDVKASNVMLDDGYNARLGDFGLARAMEHGSKSHHSTVALAGTRGYIAPECYFTGRASPETDVFAFGVFAMEVACGRRPGNYGGEEASDEVESSYVVDWVWDLHGMGRILEAADPRLGGEYDKRQMDCVLRLALACCHPNHQKRPSMRMGLQVLSGEAVPPNPEAEKPAFVWPVMSPQPGVLELPTVGLLFMGGYLSHSSISGR